MSNEMIMKVEGSVLVLERMFNAPRELVFEAFSKAEHLKHWWGPKGWSLPVCTVDFRPGGVWHYCMKCEDRNQGEFYGMESWGKGVYEEIVAPEKIVYTDYFSDAEGNEAEGMPAAQTTLLFEDLGQQTKLVNLTRYETPEALQSVLDMGMEQGIAETWERFDAYLLSLQQA